jgi:hypothetical protein
METNDNRNSNNEVGVGERIHNLLSTKQYKVTIYATECRRWNIITVLAVKVEPKLACLPELPSFVHCYNRDYTAVTTSNPI